MPGRAYTLEMLIEVMMAGCSSTVMPSEHTTRDGSHALLNATAVSTYLRAVQFHPHGGQFDSVWLPARVPHGVHVW